MTTNKVQTKRSGKGLQVEISARLAQLPTYPFAELDKKKAEFRAQGRDVIDLGIGDPDYPTPPQIVTAMKRALEDAANHRYPPYEGTMAFKQAVANWFKRKTGQKIDPETEVLALIGSKEGIAHLPLAFVNPGDVVLIPDPGYPVYRTSTIFAGGEPYPMPLKFHNSFLPDLTKIPSKVSKRAKLMFLNYPNNPTSSVADDRFLRTAVAFAKRNKLLICHDAAYADITFDGYESPSFLTIDSARDVCIEMYSFSKTFNMSGWRAGFAIGNSEAVAALGKVKTNFDSGVFMAIQAACVEALNNFETIIRDIKAMYEERRSVMVNSLKEMGFEVEMTRATFYVWIAVPHGYTSQSFAKHLLENAFLVVTPGTAFGPEGEGYVRAAMTCEKERLVEAIERIRKVGC
jgi:LL-diaminopimelate aminotransferase